MWTSASGIKHNIRLFSSNLFFKANQHTALVKEKFDSFHATILDKTHGSIYEKSELSFLNKDYDAFVCGSDQIWNRNITDLDGAFFLDFANTGKITVAYAPSLGMASDKVEINEMEIFRRQLGYIQHLSVREANNMELISNLAERYCEVVVDPVLLLTKTDWEKLTSKAGDVCPDESYAFYYPVIEQPELETFALSECKRRGIKLLNPRLVPSYANRKGYTGFPKCIVGPLEFLKLLSNAELVFTNSFHGTVFSTVFSKELYILKLKGTQAHRNNRYIEYLKLIDLYDDSSTEDSIHIDCVSEDYLTKKIDMVVEKSIKYLRDSI